MEEENLKFYVRMILLRGENWRKGEDCVDQ